MAGKADLVNSIVDSVQPIPAATSSQVTDGVLLSDGILLGDGVVLGDGASISLDPFAGAAG
jgi:hypothetical protein